MTSKTVAKSYNTFPKKKYRKTKCFLVIWKGFNFGDNCSSVVLSTLSTCIKLKHIV